MELTPKEKDFYKKEGYLLTKQLIPTNWMKQITQETENLHSRMWVHTPEGVNISWEDFKDPKKPKQIKQLMNSELICPTLNHILRSDLLLNIVESLIGPEISLYHSKLLLKTAYHGTSIPWHQDYAYWKNEENKPLMVNYQLAIDRAKKDNGCIQFIPGSHRWGLQKHDRAKQTFGVFLPGHYYERQDAIPVEMQPGDGVFFNALIVHGSAPNTSSRSRRMNTFAYNATGNGQCREALRGKNNFS